jgi:hypothetical protein
VGVLIVIAGLLLSLSVWRQFGSTDIVPLLWCLAIVPYLVGFVAVRSTSRPISAGCGIFAGFCLDLIVRSLAWNDSKSGWTGVALMFWPIWVTIVILIVGSILSVFERRKTPTP